MAEEIIQKIQKKLHKKLDEKRYRHTLGVMYTSAALAMAHGQDWEKAQLAGLLHDCAKCFSDQEQLKLCRKHKIPISSYERANPYLLHAKLGAYFAREKYGVGDEDVLNAIRSHTTGKPRMAALEQIVYIADYIEPMRCTAPRLDTIRRLAFQDLDQCMYEILKDTLEHLSRSHKDIDIATKKAFQYYGAVRNSQEIKG